MAQQPKSSKGNLALRINTFRQVHVYVSMIVAPLLVFWTITGAFQVFRIPDKHPTSLLAKLASVHKNATFAAKAAPAGGGRGGGATSIEPGRRGGAAAADMRSASAPRGASAAAPLPVTAPAPAQAGDAGGRALTPSTNAGSAARPGGAQAGGGRGGTGAPAKAPPKLATTLFKWYEAIASIALTVSTFLGMWMGIAYHRRKGLMWLMLALGVIIPVILLAAAV